VRKESCDLLVIGSGPGGAMTAMMAAEAGRDVLVVEEGHDHTIDSAPSFSLDEMDQKYRNGGLNMTFGQTNITYLEGRCVGGGSEINAGLYHRPLESTLAAWAAQTGIDDFAPEQVWPHFEAVERDCVVNLFPKGPGPASELLRLGAGRMGWSTREIARFWTYDRGDHGAMMGRRQSMSETLVPRARKAGARLLPDTRVIRIIFHGVRAVSVRCDTSDAERRVSPVEISFRELFVCAGAVQTPLLLRRSGLLRNVGDSLRLHPMIRVVATFPDEFNAPHFGVPSEQVDQFKPELTLGCSYSSVPHLSLWMGNEGGDKRQRLKNWRKTGIFYVAAVGEGVGRIRELPLLKEPFIRLPLTQGDLARLGEGLLRLGQLLFAAGATEITSPVSGGSPIRDAVALEALCRALPQGRMAVSTIHLFSSIPMGTSPGAGTDSWGRLHGVANAWVNDASLFPASPAVNPQGTVLALARRNIVHQLGG
jgi:choline dehydrogenase-like flavoprotein